MSLDNQRDGYDHYRDSDEETRQWFQKQWGMWPERADERFTTNLSFHYGGVLAYREGTGRDPSMSEDFSENIGWLDRHQ